MFAGELLYWVHHIAPLGLFLVLGLESLGLPAPVELSLLAAGYALAGSPLAVLALAGGLAGSLTGSTLAYALGRTRGREFLLWIGSHWGLTAERLDGMGRKLLGRGFWLLVVARFVPGLKSFVSYPAGLVEVPYRRFLAASALGTGLYSMFFLVLGAWLGRQALDWTRWLTRDVDALQVLIIAAGVIVIAAVSYWLLASSWAWLERPDE